MSLTWFLEHDQLIMSWVETDGPTVEVPQRRGLGAKLLTAQPGLDEVILDYLPDGLRCSIKIKGAEAV